MNIPPAFLIRLPTEEEITDVVRATNGDVLIFTANRSFRIPKSLFGQTGTTA